MTTTILRVKDSLLWPLSILAGLLLQIILTSFLWGICTSYDEMQPPVLRLISLSHAVIEAKSVAEDSVPFSETTLPEPKTVIEEVPAVETKALSEPEVTESEPVPEKIQTIPEPVKTLPEVIKPKIEPIKPKPRVKPVKKLQKQMAPPPATVVKTISAAKPLPTAHDKSIATPPQAATLSQAVSRTATPPVAASPKDFSNYLQKVYRQLERNKKYPATARRREITGKVSVAFSIDIEGKAVGAAVTSKSPRELAEAAIKLVASQKFTSPPAGWSAASRVEMQISYSLR